MGQGTETEEKETEREREKEKKKKNSNVCFSSPITALCPLVLKNRTQIGLVDLPLVVALVGVVVVAVIAVVVVGVVFSQSPGFGLYLLLSYCSLLVMVLVLFFQMMLVVHQQKYPFLERK